MHGVQLESDNGKKADLADKFAFLYVYSTKSAKIYIFSYLLPMHNPLNGGDSCDIIRRLCKRYIIIILERRGKEMKAFLILEDGTVFEGTHIGADNEVSSEIVFNTSMAG